MKKIVLLISLVAAVAAVSAVRATPVWFPLVGITGSANSRDILVIPDPPTNVLVYSNRLVALQPLLLHPVRGNATNDLLPWGYTLRVDGWSRSAHIVVPNTTNLVNAALLITNALAIGFPITQFGATTGFSGTVTNLGSLSDVILGVTAANGDFDGYYYATNLQVTVGNDSYTNIFVGTNSLYIAKHFVNGVFQKWVVIGNFGGTPTDSYYGGESLTTPPDNVAWLFDGPLVAITENATTFIRYNLTTFSNGVCVTNVLQP